MSILRVLSIAIASLLSFTLAYGAPFVLVDDSTMGRYNEGIGFLLNTNGSGDPFACNDVACGDQSLRFLTPPTLSGASGALGNWLQSPAAPTGSWSAPRSIPSQWASNTESAIIYKVNSATSIVNAKVNLGVDNGVFLWMDGQYKFGARDPGGAILGEYSVNLGTLSAGSHYLQVLREDHGQLTDYTVRMTGETGPQTLPTFTPPQSTGLVGAIDPSKPTIVITHGWQPTVDPWPQTMQKAISEKYPNANVVTYTWNAAFEGLPNANEHASNAGLALALRLKALGAKDIHFIGHSLGTYVNASATEVLMTHGVTVKQVTILDAPGLVPNEGDFFRRSLTGVRWVDNYYGNHLLLAQGSELAGSWNTFVNRGHEGVHDYYLETIGGSAGAGFSWSDVAGGSSSRPGSGVFNAFGVPLVVQPLPGDAGWSGTSGAIIDDVSFVRLSNSDPAFFWNSTFTLPGNARYLTFDFSWSELGNGNYLVAYFNDHLLFDFVGTNFLTTDFISSGLLPVSQFAGQTGQLLFGLIPFDDAHAVVSIRNLQLLTAPVPEPSTYALLSLGLALVVLYTRRRSLRLVSYGTHAMLNA